MPDRSHAVGFIRLYFRIGSERQTDNEWISWVDDRWIDRIPHLCLISTAGSWRSLSVRFAGVSGAWLVEIFSMGSSCTTASVSVLGWSWAWPTEWNRSWVRASPRPWRVPPRSPRRSRYSIEPWKTAESELEGLVQRVAQELGTLGSRDFSNAPADPRRPRSAVASSFAHRAAIA